MTTLQEAPVIPECNPPVIPEWFYRESMRFKSNQSTNHSSLGCFSQLN
jgi:hypothetical protein